MIQRSLANGRSSNKKAQKGFFIAVVLLISVILLGLSVTLHSQLNSVAKGVNKGNQDLQLRWAARSGLEESVSALRANAFLDGLQPRTELANIEGASYETTIFNNLRGQKNPLSPEAPGALSPDKKVWVGNGAAYIRTTAYLNGETAEVSLVAGASGLAGFGGFNFLGGILGDKLVHIDNAKLYYYDINYSDGAEREFIDKRDVLNYSPKTPTVKSNKNGDFSGSIFSTNLYMEILGVISVFSNNYMGGNDKGIIAEGDVRVETEGVATFIPRTVVPEGLEEGSFFIAGDDLNHRSLYPSVIGGTELQGGLLSLASGVYHVQGDLVLKNLYLDVYGNSAEPTFIIVDGNVAFDGIRANYYGAGIPGDPTALRILVRGEDHRITTRESFVSAVVCAADGLVDIERSKFFGFLAAKRVNFHSSSLFIPSNYLGVKLSLLGDIEAYRVENEGEDSEASADKILAENVGFASEPAMPSKETLPLSLPPSGLSFDPKMPKELSLRKVDVPVGDEVVRAPKDGLVADGPDIISGVPVTVYDPPRGINFACFPAGTTVATPEGAKSIELLQVGDEISTFKDQLGNALSYQGEFLEPNLLSVKASKIEKLFVHPDSRIGMVRLKRLKDEAIVELEVTEEHVVYAGDFHRWQPIGTMPKGARLLSPQGTLELLEPWSYRRIGTTYNFELEQCHTYFVGALELWVHNYKKENDPTDSVGLGASEGAGGDGGGGEAGASGAY